MPPQRKSTEILEGLKATCQLHRTSKKSRPEIERKLVYLSEVLEEVWKIRLLILDSTTPELRFSLSHNFKVRNELYHKVKCGNVAIIYNARKSLELSDKKYPLNVTVYIENKWFISLNIEIDKKECLCNFNRIYYIIERTFISKYIQPLLPHYADYYDAQYNGNELTDYGFYASVVDNIQVNPEFMKSWKTEKSSFAILNNIINKISEIEI